MPPQESPSKKLISALNQYAEELEAIKNSLEGVMTLFGIILKDQEAKLKEFVATHGQETKKEGETPHITLPAQRIAEYRRLNSAVRSSKSSQRLLPRNLLVALVCSYDALLGKLIRFVLEVKPGILDSSERQLSFSDLQQFKDIEAAREFIIEKEVETVLRKSHIEHFKWLEKTLGTSFTSGLKSWPEFVELTERRNLFVHTDGVVSSQYLNNCNSHKSRLDEGVAVGTRLGVTGKYFHECFSCLYEIGVKMAHVIWRRLLKTELKQIDENLSGITFSLIEKREYGVAIRILEHFTSEKVDHHEDAYRRIMLINLAQAYKWSDRNDECQKLLQSHDWSACQERFGLAVAVLREQWHDAFNLMRRLKNDDSFPKSAYKEWPLFRQLRKQDKFPAVYKDCYNEAFELEEAISPSDFGDGKSD